MTTQLEFQSTGAGVSQCDLILAHLRQSRGQWVQMPDLVMASGSFNIHSRISDLRKRGHTIEHKNEQNERGAERNTTASPALPNSNFMVPVFAYYGNVPDLDRESETKLQLLWRQHWMDAGFNPRVLTERDAYRHPGYCEYIDVMAKLPTINPKGYDLACYSRWVAVTQAIKEAGAPFAFMSDYDTFPTFRTWDDVDALCRHLVTPGDGPDDEPKAHHLVCYQKCVPCFVGGTAEQFSLQCARFAKYTPPPGTTHTSDMLILEAQAAKEPDSYKALHIARLWSEPGWEDAPLIHFSNSVMGPANKFPRWKFIPEILEGLKK